MDIVLALYDICILVDVIIIDLTRANLVSQVAYFYEWL